MNNYLSDKISAVGEKLSVPEGILRGDAVIELINNKKIRIENHKGIYRYSPDEVIIKTNDMKVVIAGDSLMINEYISEEIIISGRIDNISFM